MNSINTHSDRSAFETLDLEQAMQQGRRLRSQAFTSFLRSIFRRSAAERGRRNERQSGLSPDCAAAA